MPSFLRHSAAPWLVVAVLAAVAGCTRDDAAPVADDAPAVRTDAAAAPAPAAAVAETPVAQPEPDAKAQATKAMENFLAAKSYHAELTTRASGQAVTMEMDFVAPDRYRMKTPMGTQYVVGETMYITMNGRTLKTPLPKDQGPGDYRDPARFAEHKATMTVEALGSDAVDGQPAEKYLVRNTQPQPGESTLWVGAEGYPLKMEVVGRTGGQATATTIRYSRFNDPAITIDPPR